MNGNGKNETCPPTWANPPLTEVVDVISDGGKRVKQSEYQEKGAHPVIDQGESFIGGYTNDKENIYSGPLPVIIFGDHTRRFKFVDFPFVVGAQGIKILHPKSCWNPMCLFYLAQSVRFTDRGYSRHFQFLTKCNIPLPPKDEQGRIVEEIEKQFTRLDAAVEALKRIQANLKRYRASVLKAAVEGRLVPTEAELARKEGRDYEPASELLKRILAERRKRWEEDYLAKMKTKGKIPEDGKWKAKYKEPTPPDTSTLPDLPEGWIWSTTQIVCSSVRDGTHDTPKYVDDGIPLITSKNLSPMGLDFSNTKLISRKDHLDISRRSAVDKDDVLFAMIGTIGNPVVVEYEDEFSIKNVGLFKGNVGFVDSRYLRFWLMSEPLNQWLKPSLKGTTQKFAPLELLRCIPIPFPPLAEQNRIAAEIDRRFSDLDSIAATLNATNVRAGRLRRSTLKHAFEGKLVEQDPNDEPASILLERIQADQENAGNNRKQKSRRPRKQEKALRRAAG